MHERTRAGLLHWLFLLGPSGSAALFGLGMWFLSATDAADALSRAIPSSLAGSGLAGNRFFPSSLLPAIGWLLLTLGCSAGTCFRLIRKQGTSGAPLVIYMLVATPILALVHIVFIAGVVFYGCLAMFNSGA